MDDYIEILIARDQRYPIIDYFLLQPVLTRVIRQKILTWWNQLIPSLPVWFRAVRIFDVVASRVEIPQSQIESIAIGCLILAEKYEAVTISREQLELAGPNFRTVEEQLLTILQSQVGIPTIYDFLNELPIFPSHIVPIAYEEYLQFSTRLPSQLIQQAI